MVNKTDKKIMVDYLLLCVDREDWHGVSDAANDIRVLEAQDSGSKLPIMVVPKSATER